VGASAYVQSIHGDDLEAAYRAACDEAGYEHGNSYSGAINMSNGIFLAQREPLLPWDANHAANELIRTNRVQKWESVGAIRVAKPLTKRTIKITVDTTDCNENWPNDEVTAKVVAAVQFKMKDGEGIISLNATTSEKVRPDVTTPKGAAKVAYFLTPAYAAGSTLYDSQAEARAAAVKAMKDSPSHVGSIAVRATKVASNGSQDLVTVSRVVTKRTTTVEATVGIVGEPVNSWEVAGVYAS
jgi:hypothetical protein